MPDQDPSLDPFYRPEKPNGFWQLLHWLFNEYFLLYRFEKSMTASERRKYFLVKVFPRLAAFTTLLTVGSWLVITAILAATDFPYYHQAYF